VETHDIVIIGGGQMGLSLGYYAFEPVGEALGGRFLRLGFADHADDLGERTVTR
jgi:hypothetical protein